MLLKFTQLLETRAGARVGRAPLFCSTLVPVYESPQLLATRAGARVGRALSACHHRLRPHCRQQRYLESLLLVPNEPATSTLRACY